MSESLKECEVESIEDGDHVRRGSWKCGKCPEPPITWESRVPFETVERYTKTHEEAELFIASEHRESRRMAGGVIMRHLGQHDDT